MNKFINFKKLIFSLFLLAFSFSKAFLVEDETNGSEPVNQIEMKQNRNLEWEQIVQEDEQSRFIRAKHFNIFQNELNYPFMPDDILLEIISKFEDPKNLYRLLNINKRFRRLMVNKYGRLKLPKNINDEQLQQILKKYPNIRSVDLSGCTQITDTGLQSLANCHKLRHLNLSFCNKITVASLILILDAPCNLKTIDITGCTQITDANLQKLKKALPEFNIELG
ncbi:hypothetical protein K9L05_00815 [Candidatus Babeliales bacterium]|nr:hypothetical protein [Candidatus Babeliales bacterium]